PLLICPSLSHIEEKSLKKAHEMSSFRRIFPPNQMRSISPQYYTWKIMQNPFKSGLISLAKRDGKTVGSATITPKPLYVLGKEILGAEIGDTFTHPSYQRQGIFSQRVKDCTEFAISSGIQLIYGTPNDQSLPGYQTKLGYLPCNHARVTEMLKFVDIRCLKEKIRKKVRLRGINELGAYAYTSYQWIKQKKLRDSKREFEIQRLQTADSTIDDLSRSRINKICFSLIKNEEYITWRFFNNPEEYDILFAINNSKILGYIVGKVVDIYSVKTGILGDFATYNDRDDIFLKLLEEMEYHFASKGVQIIRVWCVNGNSYYRVLSRRGYLKKSEIVLIVFAGTELSRQLINCKGQWDFTIADSDNI
ncbi:MAG: GNAT family N-acetyltransferase, partial [Candidatus Hodarchaeota archaeon]